MKFAYWDLGYRTGGERVRVRLRGTEANVFLVDEMNFAAYRSGRPYRYVGGHYRQSPVFLVVPGPGTWHVVVNLGDFAGEVAAEVDVA